MAPRLRAVAPYVLVLALAGALFHIASGFTYARIGDRLGPDVWPRAILLLTMVTCAVRIARVLWWGPKGGTAGDAAAPIAAQDAADDALSAGASTAAEGVAADEAPGEAPALHPLRLAVGIGATVLYVLLLPVLGFALATFVFIAAMCRIGDYRRWRVIVPTALAGSLAFMFVFQRIVYVSLPIGVPPFDAVALTLMQLMGIR
jgi:putative tricarboxylic transport membrane protein